MNATSLFLDLLTGFFLVQYRYCIDLVERAQAYRFLASCVILAGSLNLSEPRFSLCGVGITVPFVVLLCG